MKFFTIIQALVLSVTLSFGQHIVKESTLTLPSTVNGATPLEVEDPEYEYMTQTLSWSNKFWQETVYNNIGVRLNHNQIDQMKDSLDVSVSITVTYQKWDYNTNTFETLVEDVTLRLIYTNDATVSRDIDIVRFPGGNNIQIEITSITVNSLQPAGFPTNVELFGQIDVERHYRLSTSPVNNITHQIQNGELLVNWDNHTGGQYYQVEWTFINDYIDNIKDDNTSHTKKEPSEIVLPDRIFQFNSTRVEVNESEYRIPLIYESGYVLYRIRAVGKNKLINDYYTQYSQWSANDSEEGKFLNYYQNINNYAHFSGHETDLNWTASTVFAEEGKRKSIVNYFDGSSRSRQQVTQLNTENQALVGETIYDQVGRPTINVLPVPAANPQVKYYQNFNLADNTSTPYNYTHFESGVGACELNATPMAVESGASRYYSPNNPDKSDHQAFLPDAHKFPFSQIQYSNDKTNRRIAQGGVGLHHQIGTEHETRFLYDIPEQWELDQLFGSDVGYNNFYQRVTQIDPNGQATISYLDDQGRVIATALAGPKPQNLEAISSYDSVAFPVDLLANGGIGFGTRNVIEVENDKAKATFNRKKVILLKGNRSLNYQFNLDGFEITPCGSTDPSTKLLYDTELDLRVSLKNQCGEELLASRTANISTPAGSSTNFSQPWDAIWLDVGEYQISKQIKVDERKLEQMTIDYLNRAPCILTLDSTVEEELVKISGGDCLSPCETCTSDLDEKFTTIPTIDNYEEYIKYYYEKNDCSISCGREPNKCFTAFKEMLSDMSPHGQYGKLLDNEPQVEENENGDLIVANLGEEKDGEFEFNELENDNDDYNVAKHKLSIYNSNNSLPRYKTNRLNNIFDFWYLSTRPYFSRPRNYNGELTNYKNEDGTISKIYIRQEQEISIDDEGNLVIDTVDVPDISIFLREPQPDPETGQYYILPKRLPLDYFIEYWQDSWAKQLVYYHPEFSIFEQCIINIDVHDYAAELNTVGTRQEALSAGYITNSDMDFSGLTVSNLSNDPLFSDANSAYNPMDYTLLAEYDLDQEDFFNHIEDRILSFAQYAANDKFNIWETAYMIENCPIVSTGLACESNNNCPEGGSITNDEEWRVYKGLYSGLRQDYVDYHQNLSAISVGAYNACIGNPEYSIMQMRQYFTEDNNLPSEDYTLWGYLGHAYKALNSAKVCGAGTYQYYSEKTARFPTRDNYFVGYDNQLLTCDPKSNDKFPEFECHDLITLTGQTAQQRINLDYYKRCGQCPLTRDFGDVLSAIIKQDALNTSFGFGCDMKRYPEVTPLFVQALLANQQGQLEWLVQSNTNANPLLVSLGAEDGEKCSIQLYFSDMNGNTIPGFDAGQLTDMCCMKFEPNPTLFTPDPQMYGKTFSSHAYYNGQKILIEGFSSCLDLGNCSFEAVCTVSKTGAQLQNLLNIMNIDLGQGKILTQSSVDLSSSPYKELITDDLKEDAFEDLLSGTWMWEAVVSGNELMGEFLASNGGGVMISFTKYSSDFTFDDIKLFGGITQNKTGNGSVDDFEVRVLVDINGEDEVRSLTGNASSLTVLKCTDELNINLNQQ